MNRTNKPFKSERRAAENAVNKAKWDKLLAGGKIDVWQQGDSITMGDGRMYIVQRTGEWHKVVEETR